MQESEHEIGAQHRVDTPNPGSDEAIRQGCICAVLDNNHGRYAPWPAMDGKPPGWWVTAGCPIHAPKDET